MYVLLTSNPFEQMMRPIVKCSDTCNINSNTDKENFFTCIFCQ